MEHKRHSRFHSGKGPLPHIGFVVLHLIILLIFLLIFFGAKAGKKEEGVSYERSGSAWNEPGPAVFLEQVRILNGRIELTWINRTAHTGCYAVWKSKGNERFELAATLPALQSSKECSLILPWEDGDPCRYTVGLITENDHYLGGDTLMPQLLAGE
jgi:hypothetical protein